NLLIQYISLNYINLLLFFQLQHCDLNHNSYQPSDRIAQELPSRSPDLPLPIRVVDSLRAFGMSDPACSPLRSAAADGAERSNIEGPSVHGVLVSINGHALRAATLLARSADKEQGLLDWPDNQHRAGAIA
ncbi:hypothetical protein, partial [uncultured Nevskia sp.]|uniref:hypothetical protein n=1 Tax=uncultured Nevskia sp. TaxID=228950 RepID=UPI0025DD16C9